MKKEASLISGEPSDKSEEEMKEESLSRQLSGDNNYDL
jgi:hypothetical protein